MAYLAKLTKRLALGDPRRAVRGYSRRALKKRIELGKVLLSPTTPTTPFLDSLKASSGHHSVLLACYTLAAAVSSLIRS